MEALKNQFIKLKEKGVFHIFFGSLLSKFVAFFGSVFLIRVLSKTSYGVLGYIENIYGYIYIFAGMGLGNALLRYVILAKTDEEKLGHYKYTIKTGTKFNIILVLIVSTISIFYPHPEEFASAKWLLIIILFAMPFQFLTDSNSLTYRAMLDNKRYAMTAFITSVAVIASKYIGAVLFDLNGVVAANIIINAIFGISICIVTYNIYFKGKQEAQIEKNDKKLVNRYSIQYMITNGIWAIFMLNDIFLLGRITGSASVVADYKVAYVLAGNVSIISMAIGIFIGPYFVKHESDHRWVWENYKKVFLATAGIIAPIVLILFIFAKPIISVLYGAQYENTVIVLRALLIAAFANSGLRFTTAHILSSMGQIKYNMIISCLGMLCQIGINILIIPIYGALGAAITSILVYSVMAISLFVVFIKKYRLPAKV